MARLPQRGRPWHLIEKPRAPFRCDVCGVTIPDHEAASFTTLPKMYYETPPAGYEPCNRPAPDAYDPWNAEYEHTHDSALGVSSGDRHPEQGGRFVFERDGDAVPATYRVEVFLPDRVRLATVLSWDGEKARLDPPLPDEWARDETLKLARVLHQDHRSRLSRWRPRTT